MNFAAGETDVLPDDDDDDGESLHIGFLTVSVLPDDDDDDGESLHIGFGSLTEGVGIGRNSGKTINFGAGQRRDNTTDSGRFLQVLHTSRSQRPYSSGNRTCTATEGGANVGEDDGDRGLGRSERTFRATSKMARTPYDKGLRPDLAARGYRRGPGHTRPLRLGGRLHMAVPERRRHLRRAGRLRRRRVGRETAGLRRSGRRGGTAWCIWQLAGAAPPHLGALFASGMASRILDLTFGVFRRAGACSYHGGRQYRGSTRAEADLQWHEVERGKWIWRLPLADIDRVFSTLSPMLKRYMREQNSEFSSTGFTAASRCRPAR